VDNRQPGLAMVEAAAASRLGCASQRNPTPDDPKCWVSLDSSNPSKVDDHWVKIFDESQGHVILNKLGFAKNAQPSLQLLLF
jgi:hypothetical protein